MIVQYDNKEFKEILELLQENGFIVNHTSNNDYEVCMQKDSVQIDLTDLKGVKMSQASEKLADRDYLLKQLNNELDLFNEDDLKRLLFELQTENKQRENAYLENAK